MADNKVNSGLLEFSEDQKVFVALDAETSEVKKAVTIDGDGVETPIGGGGGSVTVEALNVTENGTYSEEGKAYSPVTVEVEGVLSTAEVTLILTPPADVTFVEEAVMTAFLAPAVNHLYECVYLPATNHIVTVVLNPAQVEPCTISNIIGLDSNETDYSTLSNVETTGGVTWSSEYQNFIVTGNGTIKADVALM